VRLAIRVNVHVREWVLLDCASVYMLECANLLTNSVPLDLEELPAKVHINASLAALLKGDLVGVWELVDPLVWGPVSDTC